MKTYHIASIFSKDSSLEFLARRSHVQLMCPKTRLLVMQPEVCFTDGIGTHFLACLLVFSVFVYDAAIGNGVYNVDTLLAHLAGQCLGELAD